MIKLLLLSIIIQKVLMEQFLPKGTFSFEVNSLEKCPYPGTNDMIFNIRLSRQSMKRVNFVGNATMKVPLDETIKVDYVFDKFGNGGWKVNAYVNRIEGACESLEIFTGDVFRDMFGHCVEGECMKKKSKTPYCPVVPGVYEWRNVDVKRFTELYLPGAFAGKWRFNIKLIKIKTNTLVGCFRTVLTVQPKAMF